MGPMGLGVGPMGSEMLCPPRPYRIGSGGSRGLWVDPMGLWVGPMGSEPLCAPPPIS